MHLLTNWCFKPHKYWELNVMKTACREGTFDPSKLQHLFTDWRRNFSYSYMLYSARNKFFIYLFTSWNSRKFYKFCFSCVNVKKNKKNNLMSNFKLVLLLKEYWYSTRNYVLFIPSNDKNRVSSKIKEIFKNMILAWCISSVYGYC